MIASSSIIGLIGIAIAYLIAIPLGSYMALFKNSWFDSISTATLTFMMSLPTIALVYIVRLAGSFVGLPDSFPVLGAQDWRSYVLPSLILGLLSAPFIAVWIRRYMIDIHSQDFVRFARSKGLSEREISRKHIFKNAMVPLVSGIPGSIIGVISGATLTETVFALSLIHISGLNWVARYAEEVLKEGDEVLISIMEHHSKDVYKRQV